MKIYRRINYEGWKVLWFYVIMILLALSLAGCSDISFAGEIKGYTLDQWANAIHKAEGNDNYGILSVKCTTTQECRQVCKNTVKNNYRRWRRSEQNISFLRFLGQRYCPIGAGNDPLGYNRYWIKNVSYFLAYHN